MTGTEYKNEITSALNEADQTADPISIIRSVLGNCDIDFPYGDCRGILAALSENDFTGWRTCSYEEAKKFADEGVPTVGINADRVILIAPDSDSKYDCDFVQQADSLTSDGELKFFAYSEPLSEKAYDLGATKDVPQPQATDGFGGWYIPSSANTGVTRNVPRFVQTGTGPCLAYSIMSGNYYMKNLTTDPDTFFNDRYKEGYLDADGNALWRTFTTAQNYSRNTLKAQLNSGKPVVVSGNNGSYDHFVLVVAYTGCGTLDSDYIVIDPLSTVSFPTTFAAFKKSFPYDTTQFKSGQDNYTYPMFTFK